MMLAEEQTYVPRCSRFREAFLTCPYASSLCPSSPVLAAGNAPTVPANRHKKILHAEKIENDKAHRTR